MDAETTTSLVDTALASGAASALDPEERRVQELVLAIRDDAPKPEAGFALRMDARVAAGFPSRRRLPSFAVPRPRLAIAGGLAAVVVALAVAVSVGEHPDRAGPAGSASGSAAVGAASAKHGTAQSTIAVPQPAPVGPGGFVGGSNRRVERSAELALAPDRDKLNDVGDQVIAVTDRYHGIVMQSSVTSSADQSSSGSFDLRIPVRNLQSALRDLSALADVASRTQTIDDVTSSFVNVRTRLQELNAERRGLLRRLERAPTDQAAAATRARLRIVNTEIQAQANQLTDLRRRTSYAAVNVTLDPKPESAGGGGLSGGARDLRDSLVDAANIALRVLGVALPLALLGALLWAFGGWLTRRQREAALD